MKPKTFLKTTLLRLSLGILMGLPLMAHATPSNKQLTIGMAQEFESMNPLIMSMSASNYV